MNLYRIIVLHGAPKDSHTSTETYLIAADDKSVAKWIEDSKCSGMWFTPYMGDEPTTRTVDIPEAGKESWECKSEEVTFEEYILRNCGDLEDEEGWEDAYYGVTKWGWSVVVDATTADMKRLVELGIAQQS